MEKIKNQILQTWRLHNKTMIYLIENIQDEAFNATLSKRGGRNISRQLAHVNMVRVWRLESFAKKNSVKLISFESEQSPAKAQLIEAFTQSSSLMEKYIQLAIENDGEVSNFKRGVVIMVGYYISHEAHHRGNILLTMKQCGFKLSDNLKWNIWDWNKI